MGITLAGAMPKKKQPSSEFGVRLMTLRQAKGLTQVQLAEAAGTTQRAISYYETDAEWPTVPQAIALAKALHVTTDELFGLKRLPKASTSRPPREERRLWKKLRLVAALPQRDQRAVLRLIDSVALATHARRSA